jgi:hypothetical protein
LAELVYTNTRAMGSTGQVQAEFVVSPLNRPP